MPFFNPYKLRHSYATALRAQGMDLADVQELMGHKSRKDDDAAVRDTWREKKLATAAEMLHQAWHPEHDRRQSSREGPRPERSPGSGRPIAINNGC